ncbi:MAG: DUF4013 domain-containing protein [Anaerolineales bacterium]
MDLERAFTFFTKDPDWLKKLVIAGVLTLTGIGGIAVFGWLAEVARRAAQQEDEFLPEWDQLGDYFLTGLKFMGVTLIWSSPAIVLTIVFSIIPAGVLFAMPESDQGIAIAMISIFSICFWGIFMIYILAVNFLIPPLWVPVAEGMPFSELLNPRMAWHTFRANAGGFIVAVLISSLVGSLLGMAGVLLCGVGIFLTVVAAQLIYAHLIGQATRQARETLERRTD